MKREKEDYEYTEYNDEKSTIPWKRILLILLMLIVVVVIALLLLRGCGKNTLANTLLEAGKDYYEKYPSNLPTEVGECKQVKLDTLLSENLLKNPSKYETCNTNQTYVNVCYLESKTYHYDPVLSCTVESTTFGIWADGQESDIKPDETDVRFKYLGEELNLGTKYYYPSNSTEPEKVVEYYATSPATGYTGEEGTEEGYKWYTTSKGTYYWNNGEYSSTQPNGYPNKGASTTISYYTTSEPVSASYRTISSGVTLYRSKTIAKPIGFYCHAVGDENSVIYSTNVCGGDFPKLVRIVYSCDGTNEVARESTCSDYTDWTTNACTSSVSNGTVCESVSGYSYVDTMWKWYKNSTITKYYPSGASTAAKEKTYYLTAPTSGAIRDDSTKATVHKYYKLVKDENVDSNYEEWMGVTDGYVDETELITAFKDLGYEVENLSDINALENIRYQYQLQYRNLEK